MIFSFKKNKISAPAVEAKKPSNLECQRLIDASLVKLSVLQQMGRSRTEGQILLVMSVLQRSLYFKSMCDFGQLSIAELIQNFELEIMKGMDRSGVEKLPRLWIDLPESVSRRTVLSTASRGELPFRIKAAFSRRK